MRTGRPKVALILTEDERRTIGLARASIAIGPGPRASGANHLGVCRGHGQ